MCLKYAFAWIIEFPLIPYVMFGEVHGVTGLFQASPPFGV